MGSARHFLIATNLQSRRGFLYALYDARVKMHMVLIPQKEGIAKHSEGTIMQSQRQAQKQCMHCLRSPTPLPYPLAMQSVHVVSMLSSEREKHYISSSHLGLIRCPTPVGPGVIVSA